MLYWVYDQHTHQFVKHDELQATDPVVDLQHKRIISNWFDGAAISRAESIHLAGQKVLPDRRVGDRLVNEQEQGPLKYKVENGKSVKVSQ